MKSRTVAVLAVACLAAVLGNYTLTASTNPADHPTARGPGQATATATPTNAATPTPRPKGARLWWARTGELVVDVPERAYIIRDPSPVRGHAKPVAFHRDRLAVPAKVGHGAGDGKIIIFGVDQDSRVNDVIVLHHGTLSSIQWMVSRHGVELMWEAHGDRRCTVERDNKTIAQAHEYFRDPRVPRATTSYAITCEKPVRFKFRGKTRTDVKSWSYILYAPPWDDSAIGEPVQDIRVTNTGDVTTLETLKAEP